MNQSKLESAIEQVMSTATGFALAWCAWLFAIVPLIDIGWISYTSTTFITTVFTVLSLVRGYFWRRMFNNQLPHRIVEWLKHQGVINAKHDPYSNRTIADGLCHHSRKHHRYSQEKVRGGWD